MENIILEYLYLVHRSVRFRIQISILNNLQTKLISLRSIPRKYINVIPDFSDVLY